MNEPNIKPGEQMPETDFSDPTACPLPAGTLSKFNSFWQEA